MIVTIHQPDFIPWLGFFHRWAASDLYIVLDDVQFIRRGWQHRDKIKTGRGADWLTLPVIKKGRYLQMIREVALSPDEGLLGELLGRIEKAYAAAPNFQEIFPVIQGCFRENSHLLIDLNMALLRAFAELLGIHTPVVLSSSLGVNTGSSLRLVDLVRAVGGNGYLTGTGSRDYLDEALFQEAGIEVIWQKITLPEYPQLHGPFEGMLSTLDLLMMVKDPGEFFLQWRKGEEKEEMSILAGISG